MKSAAFFWLVLLVVFLIAEAACPIHLVSIWFALGALVALLCAALSAPVWLQITLFVVVSGVLLALLWPLAKKFLNSKVTATNVDSVVGSVGRVTTDIDNVEARGAWSGRPEAPPATPSAWEPKSGWTEWKA